jgi:hypothetical protein
MALRDLVDEIKKVDAVTSLRPTANWVMADDELTWLDGSQTEPTQAEIDAEIIRLKTEFIAQEYARKRKAKYDLLNQDEMRYDDLKNSTTTWVDAIDAIKAAHPKP